jgi:hypothetical protein
VSEPGGIGVALPRRDWILLPLIVVVVTLVFLGTAELVAARVFVEIGHPGCKSAERPGPPRHTPNCEFDYKMAEGPMVAYRFNECGYRSPVSCGPKPAGTLRVVVMGTSLSLGLGVSNEETFASRLQQSLSGACRRPIEVENIGALTRFSGLDYFATDALALSPEVIVLAVLPYDLEQQAVTTHQRERKSQSWYARLSSGWRDLTLEMRDIRLVFAAEHLMLLDKQILYKTYLNGAGSRELMSVPPLPSGERKYAALDRMIARLAANLKGSGVPLVVMAVPNRVAAALVSDHSTLPGNDPRQFGRIVSEIAVRNGALALDATEYFARVPNAEQLYYPVDNHPTGAGHGVIAQALSNYLTEGAIPQLAACQAAAAEIH